MRSDCTGCKWISDEIEQRKELITEFRIRGDYKMARIAALGVESLAGDWRAHIQRDHATDLNMYSQEKFLETSITRRIA
jgi:hypothetical protein